MRVEPSPAELRGDEPVSPAPRQRGKRFRLVLRRQRSPGAAAEPVADALARQKVGHPREFPFGVDRAAGAAPPRGIERVARVENALPAPPRVVGLRAVVATPLHGAVDVSARAGSDGVLISIAAAPAMAERLLATKGGLGRRLTGLDVRARTIRVRATSSRNSTRDGGPGR